MISLRGVVAIPNTLFLGVHLSEGLEAVRLCAAWAGRRRRQPNRGVVALCLFCGWGDGRARIGGDRPKAISGGAAGVAAGGRAVRGSRAQPARTVL